MKIIVLQKHHSNLHTIKVAVAAIDPKRAEEITYTSSYEEVLDLVKDGQPTLVVSGQILRDWCSYEGTHLARDVKAINPKVLFFLYSNMPERSHYVDGVIWKGINNNYQPRPEYHTRVAKLLTSNLEGATVESLRKVLAT